MGGKGDSTTETTSQIPQELMPLYQSAAASIMGLQQAAPIQAFFSPGQPTTAPAFPAPAFPSPVSVQQPVPNQFGIQPGQRIDGFTLGSDGIWYDQNGIGQGNNWQPPSIRRSLGLSPVSNAPITATQSQQLGAQGIWGTGTRSSPPTSFLTGGQTPQGGQQTLTMPVPFQTARRAPEFATTQTLLNQVMPTASQRSPQERTFAQRPQGTTDAITAANRLIGISGELPGDLGRLRNRPQGSTDAIGAANRAIQAGASLPQSLGGLGNRPQGTIDALNSANQLFSLMGTTPQAVNQLTRQTQGMTGAINEASRLRELSTMLPGSLGQLGNQTQGVTQALQTARGLQDIARQQVGGASLQQDPGYLAAIKAFESAILPQVQNQAALSGLGRTTGLGQASAAAQAQYLLPTIQDALAREERGIERQLGAGQFLTGTQQAAGAEELNRLLSTLGYQQQGIQNQLGASQFYAGMQQAAGAEELNRILSQLQAQENVLGRQLQAGGLRIGTQQAAGEQDLNRLMQRLAYEQQGIQNQIGTQQFMSGLQQNIGAQDLDRLMNTLGFQQQGIQNRMGAQQFMSGLQQQTGQQDLQRALTLLGTDQDRINRQMAGLQFAVPQQMQLAQSQQDFSQGQLDRETQEFLRRQALAEQALYQPFGLVAPTAIGQRASTEGKK